MGDLHLVLPARNLSNLFDKDATSKIDDVLTDHGGLLHVLPFDVHLRFLFAGQVKGTILNLSYSFTFIVLKSYGVGWWGGGP